MAVIESARSQFITFLLKCMNPKFLQVVLDPPTEGHAAAHVPVLDNVVLNQDCSSLRAVKEKRKKYKCVKLNWMLNIISYRNIWYPYAQPLTCDLVLSVGFPVAYHCQRYLTTAF